MRLATLSKLEEEEERARVASDETWRDPRLDRSAWLARARRQARPLRSARLARHPRARAPHAGLQGGRGVGTQDARGQGACPLQHFQIAAHVNQSHAHPKPKPKPNPNPTQGGGHGGAGRVGVGARRRCRGRADAWSRRGRIRRGAPAGSKCPALALP
eukprot:scaffold14772_cov81-Phaeocystis_antarctica.AAC.1